MTNDYAFSIIAEQRRQEFAAEAANDRLARIATAGRTPWWRRLAHTLTWSGTQVQARGTTPLDPRKNQGLTTRQAAHSR
jgi:hypothetical protein